MWLLSIFMCVLSVKSLGGFRHHNNVCRTLLDYKTIDRNKNCRYNPDVGSTPSEHSTNSASTYSVDSVDQYTFDIEEELGEALFKRPLTPPSCNETITVTLSPKRLKLSSEDEEYTTVDKSVFPLKLIAKRYGYPFEKHSTTTKDGYILTLHRIPRSQNGNGPERRQPILLQHGLAGTSAFWMLQGNKSLAFYLADNGFDVWLSNSRGTHYSTKHISMTMNDPNYWDFGFHEMAIYDLPACIDFIANKTGEKGNLIYVGHSMGTTISYIYSIVEKQHAESNLKAIVSLAPVAHMKHVMGIFKILAPATSLITEFLRSAGINAVGQHFELQRALLSATCAQYPLIIPCNLILIFSSGLSVEQFEPELLPVFLSFYPSGVSLRTLEHFSQIINTGKFQKYDYGETKNMKIYKSPEPPKYDVSKISLPVYLFVGNDDILGNLQDATLLQNEINLEKANVPARMFVFPYAHNDFFLAKDAGQFHKTLLEITRTKFN